MTRITLEAANRIIEVALATAAEKKLKPLAVIVLDAGGHAIAYARQDGASPGRFQIAGGKAYGAVMLGLGGRAQMARAEAQAYFIAAANGALDGRLVPVPGGVLVTDASGTVIGAVGISGDTSDNDEACAVAGIEAAGLNAQP
ncbi:heme-binding protein [Halovulum dunhuangense]|uniref:Heme-binding protein n=1 Tax=Halovulum dunhuangense TaxID=1505036 RepID=A0A849L1B0_9RHOB|nr:heme-binding protein [Halovulum dunhuangense]NNU80037.1 heme-binding protein [Halovulum dunhuangense]